MSPENLSRRTILAGAAAIPAFALPAIIAAAIPAVASTEPALPIVPVQTAIGKMWLECRAARREFYAADRVRVKLKEERQRRMPKPDASIVYGEKNDKDRLRYCFADDGREPNTVHHYIESHRINRELKEIEPQHAQRTDVEGGFVLTFRENETFPFSEKKRALQERLTARLELSERYEHKIRRVSREIGLTAAERKCDRLCTRLNNLEWRILRTPTAARSDFAAKLAIHKYHGDGWGAEEMVADIRRMVAAPETFAKAVRS